MKTAEIRRRFLQHFEAADHTVVPSAPLPAIDDPNLLFVNAGMVQFVPYFLGQRTPPFSRAVSVQKCLRTPDIDEVGKTSRHGTFFQMNGNFSFGDYFKEGAIRLAWDLSTKPVAEGGYGLDGDLVWATVYQDDDEAIDIWHRVIGLPKERIVRRGKADNFWSMGIPGPCGPCSELYVDRGPAYGREGGPEADEDRYLEFWNLVFMQNLRGPGTGKEDYPILGELPAKNIDTGMGLERVAALLQGVDNMYEIDEVRPVLSRAAELTGKTYGARSGHAATESHPDDVRLRVIADHVRTALMIIGDGVTPSNEGRGYVLRRIMRRAIRSMRLLGWQEPALPELLPVARDCMAPSYPELFRNSENIAAKVFFCGPRSHG
jgi:alanyl-tRNA synthetase